MGGFESSVEGLQQALKPEYRVVKPTKLKENEDDEWTVTAPPEWSTWPIVITVTNEFTFFHDWEGEHDQLEEVKVIKTNNEELGEILGKTIPQNAKAIENLIGEEYWDNDELMDFIHEMGEVTQAIPDNFYGKGWDNQWEDFSIQVTLPAIVDENTDNEWEVEAPKEWDEIEIKIGDVITNDMKHPRLNKPNPDFMQYKSYVKDFDQQNSDWKVEDIRPEVGEDEYTVVLKYKDGTSNEMYEEEFLNKLDPNKKWRLVKDDTLMESDDEWTVTAPNEWNEEVFDGTTDEDLIVFISHILEKHNVEEQYIDEYIDQIFSYNDPEVYEGVTERAVLADFNSWYEDYYDEGIDLYGDEGDDDF